MFSRRTKLLGVATALLGAPSGASLSILDLGSVWIPTGGGTD
ncbi:hypothetical protein [Candidatus Mycoplasma haematominutum]|nr:hypothetical protein [Candidatus Mycoplasma haematominutum]